MPDTDVPVYIDSTKASIARVYDAFLNGKDNYEIDREVLRRVQQVAPEAQTLAFDNRNFLIRATPLHREPDGHHPVPRLRVGSADGGEHPSGGATDPA